jgi:hypothetical protein
VVLNGARLAALIEAYGRESNNWLGQHIRIRKGQAYYEGQQVAAVKIEAILSIEAPKT